MIGMSYGYMKDGTGLSDILAQLLKPTVLPQPRAGQDADLHEESALALTLRMLLAPDRNDNDPNQLRSNRER